MNATEARAPGHALRVAVLCRVIDNLGDAGVCWRLCRQLVREHGCQVTLFIDDRATLARVDSADGPLPRVEDWPAATSPLPTLDVLICAFGCDPPPGWRPHLAPAADRPPLWINVDHLSAEAWVDGIHGRLSIKPADAAREHYFMPGFSAQSGGLLREMTLPALARPTAQEGAPVSPGPRPPRLNGPRLSLFCYPDEPLVEWFDLLAQGPRHLELLVPGDVARDQLGRYLGATPSPGQTVRRGALTITALPWLSQDVYDALLRNCELNFVRGEDSWIRAHWAGRPFVWQPYPQEQATRLLKLDAWLDRLTLGWPDAGAALTRRVMHAWSHDGPLDVAWPPFADWLFGAPQAASGWRRFAGGLAAQSDLASRLVGFIRDRL